MIYDALRTANKDNRYGVLLQSFPQSCVLQTCTGTSANDQNEYQNTLMFQSRPNVGLGNLRVGFECDPKHYYEFITMLYEREFNLSTRYLRSRNAIMLWYISRNSVSLHKGEYVEIRTQIRSMQRSKACLNKCIIMLIFYSLKVQLLTGVYDHECR